MKTDKEKIGFLYESESDDFLLTHEEEQIMKAMRKLDSVWKTYKRRPNGNRLILFCGSAGCDIRINAPSQDNTIEHYENITCDGGDGGDSF